MFPVIPSKSNRSPSTASAGAPWRNVVEPCFCRLKDFRRRKPCSHLRDLRAVCGAIACRSCDRAVVHSPNCRLCSVLDPDLAKDCLDVDLYGGLGDINLARYALVGVTFDQTAQD